MRWSHVVWVPKLSWCIAAKRPSHRLVEFEDAPSAPLGWQTRNLQSGRAWLSRADCAPGRPCPHLLVIHLMCGLLFWDGRWALEPGAVWNSRVNPSPADNSFQGFPKSQFTRTSKGQRHWDALQPRATPRGPWMSVWGKAPAVAQLCEATEEMCTGKLQGWGYCRCSGM